MKSEPRPIAASPEARLKPVAGSDSPTIDRGGSAVALRLAIGKEGLGIELSRPASLACLSVSELVVRLPNMRFPFDVSGGVAKFRHKRGELDRMVLELSMDRLVAYASPKLRGLVTAGPCEVSILAKRQAISMTLIAEERALAFDVALLARGGSLSLVVHNARGTALPSPATTLAIRAMSALLGSAARREGTRFVVDAVAVRVAKAILPDAGVRAPDGVDIVLLGSGESDAVLTFVFGRGAEAANFANEAIAAFELATLTRDGDDLRLAGDLGAARARDLAALDRAPRHPELARRIAEIDAHTGNRAEAAIATLREAKTGGLLLAHLLMEIGDRDGATAVFLREGEREPSNALAALAYAASARLATDPLDALRWLDAALARAPRMTSLRWMRGERRIQAGRLADARADFEELEAMAQGSRARFDVLRRSGDAYRGAGLGGEAAIFYERALLYRPDDPSTLAGLGAAIARQGRPARGAALLAHAIEQAPEPWISLALARILGKQLGDRPAGIARLYAVDDTAPEAVEARGLEARFRAALGDAAGAALAYARLRERAHGVADVPGLLEAASFEEARGELRSAQAYVSVAVSLSRDPELEGRLRSLGQRVAAAAGVVAPTAVGEPVAAAPAVSPELDESELELRVELLMQKLQGDPTNDVVADELVVHLTRLNRGMELLALLSARLEDATPEKRAALLPRHRQVLADLERRAREEGRDGEADLFKMSLDASY